MVELEWFIYKLPRDISMIRINDNQTQYFEALWEIPEGISYNSYLLFTEEGGVLIDTGPKGSGAFMEALNSIASPRDIKILIVNHMEPDHSGALKELLEKNPDMMVASNPFSFKLMESFYRIVPHQRFESKDGTELKFGGETIRFFHVPWLHWPETMVSYSETRNSLFTGDVFGAYSLPKDSLKSLEQVNDPEYLWSMKKYFVNVIGAYRANVVTSVKKLRELKLNPELVLPAHGSAFSGNKILDKLLSLYESWAVCSEKGKVTVALTSMYGFSEEISSEVSRILDEIGIEHKIFTFTSKKRDNISDAVASMQDSQFIVLITSTYENSPHPLINHLVSLMEKKLCKYKKILLIGTYGWGGGAAVSSLAERLTNAGFILPEFLLINSSITQRDELKLKETIAKILQQF